MTVSSIIFGVALLCIVMLFVFKAWELRRGRIILPRIRARQDVRAQHLKELVIAARLDIGRLSPAVIRFIRLVLRETALAFAAFARASEREAHKLADLVSHKHRFERRETRSEFLKQVAEHKNDASLGEPGDF